MPTAIREDVARVLSTLLEAKAWFRHGLTDDRLCELTGLPRPRVIAARIKAAAEGLVERQDRGTDAGVTMLTPVGVARAQSEPAPLE
jgi:hypothetical protein